MISLSLTFSQQPGSGKHVSGIVLFLICSIRKHIQLRVRNPEGTRFCFQKRIFSICNSRRNPAPSDLMWAARRACSGRATAVPGVRGLLSSRPVAHTAASRTNGALPRGGTRANGWAARHPPIWPPRLVPLPLWTSLAAGLLGGEAQQHWQAAGSCAQLFPSAGTTPCSRPSTAGRVTLI